MIAAGDIVGFFKKPLVLIILSGMLIRLVIMPFLTGNSDMQYWALIIDNIQSGSGLYDISGYSYTPIWGYFLGFISSVGNFFGITDYAHLFDSVLATENVLFGGWSAVITTPVFNVLIKVPLMLVDLAVGYVIYRFVHEKTGDKSKATLGFGLWFLCPIVIYESAVHGMFDNISVLFMVLTVYLAYKEQYLLAGVVFAFAVLTKFFPAFIIFALVAYIFLRYKDNIKNAFRNVGFAAAGTLVATLVIYTPMIMDGTIIESLSFIISRASLASSLGDAGQSIWDTLTSFGFTLITLIQFAVIPILLYLAYRFYKKDHADNDLAFLGILVISITLTFVWPPLPQYILVIIPLLAIYTAVADRRFKIPLVVISVGALLYELALNNFSILLTLGAYTDVISLDWIVESMLWTRTALIGEITLQMIMIALTCAVMMAGIYGTIYIWWKNKNTEAVVNEG